MKKTEASFAMTRLALGGASFTSAICRIQLDDVLPGVTPEKQTPTTKKQTTVRRRCLLAACAPLQEWGRAATESPSKRTGLKSPSFCSLARILVSASTSPASAASCRGLPERITDGVDVSRRRVRAVTDRARQKEKKEKQVVVVGAKLEGEDSMSERR